MKYPSDLSYIKVFDAVTVSASGNSSSAEVSTSKLAGLFSLQWTITGNGTAKFEVLPSNNGADFPDIETDISTGQTKTTGPASDGKNMTSFEMSPCRSFKIKVTETGGANSITVSAWLKAI
jgi:hypothetical protein